jgi:U3 small nucleolar RNA-associated protein 3
MSSDERLSLINVDSPELLGLLGELKSRISELREQITPSLNFLVENCSLVVALKIDDDIVNYLNVKHQLLMAYTINMCYYLAMKAEGRSVRAHPVMKQVC